MSYPLLCWWLHYALFHYFQKSPITDWAIWRWGRRYRALGFWPFYYFRFEQKEPSVLQCLKNSVAPSVYSTTTSRYLSPIRRQHTTAPILYTKYSWSILIWWSQLEIPYLLSCIISFSEVRRSVSSLATLSPYQILIIHKGLVHLCVEYAFHTRSLEVLRETFSIAVNNQGRVEAVFHQMAVASLVKRLLRSPYSGVAVLGTNEPDWVL